MNQIADFHLPDEILSVIPTDPYDQLDLARKITSLAIASRVSKLEAENDRLKHVIDEKDHVIGQAEEKLRIALDENDKLAKERDTLVITAKKLARDLAKLETFKKQLMQSLSDDSPSQAETVDIRTYDQTVPGLSKPPVWSDTKPDGQRITPYISPRLTPSGTPTITSTSGSPRGYSTAGSPKMISGTTSPTKPRTEGYTSMSPWFSSSQQSSAATSPPRHRSLPGRAPRIDGKEFFRQARSRLSYEQFGAFLANIKELNAHRQSREETLKKAEEIFGTDNKDLYLSFQGLLNRNSS